jgi:crotonobetainyl-CoA:carnitine CoA-transferase CaiB-like acyl-CoA transferase
MANGGKPMWSFTSFGDTGNGFLSAIGILQALYARARTGEGSYVDTSIVNACLLNTSYAVATPEGGAFERPRLDKDQTGFTAGCRLYQARDGWVCVVAATEAQFDGLLTTAGLADLIARYPDAASRRAADAEISAALAQAIAEKNAADWAAAFDAAGVPAEISAEHFSRGVFDDPELQSRNWVVSYDHPLVGKLDQIGLLYSLSDTPGRIMSPPLVVGDQTEAIMRELGYSEADIEALIADRAVLAWPPRKPQAEFKSPWDAGAAKIAPVSQTVGS